MNLYENIFADVIEFNQYVSMRADEGVVVTPISVIPTGGKLWIFYTTKNK